MYPSSSTSISERLKLASRRAGLFCAGAFAALVALELALRLFPVNLGLYLIQEVGTTRPLRTYEPYLRFTYSMGWDMRDVRHGRTNNYGQLAPFDFVPDSRPVIVVGDSYIESQMNDYSETLQGALGSMMGKPHSVYGLGVSGLSMADYLAFAGQASAEFAPRAAVFLLVDGDIAESLLDQPGYRHFMPTPHGLELVLHPRTLHPALARLRRTFGDLYLFRYVTQNLRFTLPTPGPIFREARATEPKLDAGMQYAVVDRFLSELPQRSAIAPRCIAFLLDSDRFALYDPRLARQPGDLPEVRTYFMRRAAQLGYRVADLEPTYREHFRLHSRHFDYYPVDRHLNGLGHRLAAERAYQLLFGDHGCSR